MQIKASFTDLVQLHERKWGEESYPGRPTLDQLLNAYIVAMWVIGKRFIFSVHANAQELNDLAFAVLSGKSGDSGPRKLAKIFVNRQEFDFRIEIVPARATPDSVSGQDTVPTAQRPLEPPKVIPLPQQAHKRYGQVLPGRNVTMRPGRKNKVIRGTGK